MTKTFNTQQEREAYLRNVSELYMDWSLRHSRDEDSFDLGDSEPHDKESRESDYPLLYLDRSAPKRIEDEFFDQLKD